MEKTISGTVSTNTSIKHPSIEKLFGIESLSEVSDEVSHKIKHINELLSEEVDASQFDDVIKSLFIDMGKEEDKAARIDRILERIFQLRKLKIPLESVADVFGESIDELESQALETGNWQRFLKRSEENRKNLKGKKHE